MIGSKLHKGSVIYDATTGVENGQILHDGTYTATTTPASTDTLLIKQSGVQKQITYGDLISGALEVTELGSLSTTGALTITPSNGLNSLLVFTFAATGVRLPTLTTKWGNVSTSSGFNRLYQGSTEACQFHKTSDTQVTITSKITGALIVYEVKVV
jgi:hypothetical protein